MRDDIYAHAKRGNLGPVLEAGGLLTDQGRGQAAGGASRERPADVLLCRGQDIKVGRNSGGGRGRVARRGCQPHPGSGRERPPIPAHRPSVVQALNF